MIFRGMLFFNFIFRILYIYLSGQMCPIHNILYVYYKVNAVDLWRVHLFVSCVFLCHLFQIASLTSCKYLIFSAVTAVNHITLSASVAAGPESPGYSFPAVTKGSFSVTRG